MVTAWSVLDYKGIICIQCAMKTTKAPDQEAGRASGGSTTGVSVRLPGEMLAQIDRLANDERRTRGNAIRLLLEEALKARAV